MDSTLGELFKMEIIYFIAVVANNLPLWNASEDGLENELQLRDETQKIIYKWKSIFEVKITFGVRHWIECNQSKPQSWHKASHTHILECNIIIEIEWNEIEFSFFGLFAKKELNILSH